MKKSQLKQLIKEIALEEAPGGRVIMFDVKEIFTRLTKTIFPLLGKNKNSKTMGELSRLVYGYLEKESSLPTKDAYMKNKGNNDETENW